MDMGGAILRLMSGIKSLTLSRTFHYFFLEWLLLRRLPSWLKATGFSRQNELHSVGKA